MEPSDLIKTKAHTVVKKRMFRRDDIRIYFLQAFTKRYKRLYADHAGIGEGAYDFALEPWDGSFPEFVHIPPHYNLYIEPLTDEARAEFHR